MKKWIMTQAFRFKLAQGYLGMVTFAITLAIGIKVYGIGQRYTLIAIIIVGFLVWFIGYIMDKMKLYNVEADIYTERNPWWNKLFEKLDELKNEKKR